MQPHLTSSSTTVHTPNQDRAEELAQLVSIGDRDAGRTRAVCAQAPLTLLGAPVWRHKLILTGKLEHRTAVELDEEIECLCEEGVTVLTLDLRRLDAIDSDGARTIASRGAACKRQGRDFAVIPGSRVVHRALTEVGAESLLAGDPVETGVPRLSTSSSDGSPRYMSTAMIKNL
jgi:anti-anti-sigma factor